MKFDCPIMNDMRSRTYEFERLFGLSILGLLFLAMSILAAIGCARTPVIETGLRGTRSDQDASGLPQLRDFPVPPKAKLKTEQTLILGHLETWTGRIVMRSKLSENDLCAFYQDRMPGFGWRMISATQARVSLMSFVREDRVATLRVEASRFSGCTITAIVSPRQGGVSSPESARISGSK